MDDDRILIDEFEKNSSETVRTSISEFRGKLYCDFRVWSAGASETLGEIRPTKKGLTISTEILPDLLKAVQLAIEHVRGDRKQADSVPQADFPEETAKR